MDKEKIFEYEKWLNVLNELQRIKISPQILISQKRLIKLLQPKSKIPKESLLRAIKETGFSIENNILAIKSIVVIDRVLSKMEINSVDASNIDDLNSLSQYCVGIHKGIFDISYPILSKNYKQIIDKYRNLWGGKKITPGDEKIYNGIIDEQKKLAREGKTGQSVSLSQATRNTLKKHGIQTTGKNVKKYSDNTRNYIRKKNKKSILR